MFLIVCHHYAVHGHFEFTQFSFNKIIVQILSYGGKLGVNLFVLISGYFLVCSGFKGKKAAKLWIDVTIYSVIITGIFFLMGEDIGGKELIRVIFPILYSNWWFVTSYFVMFVLSGYLNVFINGVSKKQLNQLILVLIMICSVLPTFFRARMADSKLIWFILLYLIAARIRLYPIKMKCFNYSLLLGVAGYALCLLSCVIFNILGLKFSILNKYTTYFAGMEKTTMLLCAVFLFIGFKNLKIGTNKFINTMASTTFGIYLIHENKFVRKFLWINLFKNAEYSDSNMLVFHAAFAITMTFIVCSVLSHIYNLSIGRFIEKLLDKYYIDIECNIKKWLSKIRWSWITIEHRKIQDWENFK